MAKKKTGRKLAVRRAERLPVPSFPGFEERMREMDRWMHQLEHAFDRPFGVRPWFRGPGLLPRRFALPRVEELFPSVDVFEREGKLVVRADLPGMKAEDIDCSVQGNQLVIRGHRREEKEVKKEDYYSSERTFGEFYRSIPVPEGTKTEEIEASYKDGILEVTVPKPQAGAASKKVKVQTS